MLRTCVLSIPFTIAAAGLWTGTATAALDPGYLAGTWEVNAQSSCGAEKAEQLALRDDGSFDYGRRGIAEAVGFWRVDGDILVLDMMTMPASFKDIYAELQDALEYRIYTMRAMPIDMQPDQFSAVASIGDQMQRFSLRRCQ
jgi:hypothetical protein